MGIFVIVFLAASLGLWTNQNDYIFEPATALQTTPERFGLKAEVLSIPSGSGNERGEMFSWWIASASTDAPTVLYFHGNDKNIGHARDLEYVEKDARAGLQRIDGRLSWLWQKQWRQTD